MLEHLVKALIQIFSTVRDYLGICQKHEAKNWSVRGHAVTKNHAKAAQSLRKMRDDCKRQKNWRVEIWSHWKKHYLFDPSLRSCSLQLHLKPAPSNMFTSTETKTRMDEHYDKKSAGEPPKSLRRMLTQHVLTLLAVINSSSPRATRSNSCRHGLQQHCSAR